MYNTLLEALKDQKELLEYKLTEREHQEGREGQSLLTIGIVDLEMRIERTEEALAGWPSTGSGFSHA